MTNARTRANLIRENDLLRAQLADSEEVFRAIRGGEVDAFFVEGGQGRRVLTLSGTEEAYRGMIEAMNEGAAILGENGAVIYCNGRLSSMVKAPLETVMGSPLYRFISPADRKVVAILLGQGNKESCSKDVTLICADGSDVSVQFSVSPMHVAGLDGVCLVVTDLTARNLVKELRNLSLYDDLTGLCNRRGFFTLAQQQRILCRRLKTETALVFIDMDGFKAINDQLGHLTGDRALTDVACLLKNTYRESDIIARIGGDEFAILASGTPTMRTDMLRTRLRTNLDAFNKAAHRPYKLAMSVGMVRCDPDNSVPIDDLLALADAAMYRRKRRKHKPTNLGERSRPPDTPSLPTHASEASRLPRMIS